MRVLTVFTIFCLLQLAGVFAWSLAFIGTLPPPQRTLGYAVQDAVAAIVLAILAVAWREES